MAIQNRAQCGKCGAEGEADETLYAAILPIVGPDGSIKQPDTYAVCGDCFTKDYNGKYGFDPEGVVPLRSKSNMSKATPKSS